MAGGKLTPFKKGEKRAEACGKRGGIESGKVKREKKFLSDMYGEILAEEYGMPKSTFKQVVKDIVNSRQPAAVSMLKEIREATEGTKIKSDATIQIIIDNQDNKL